MPPTIPRFTESNNPLPSVPGEADIAPTRFGRDSAALAELGGQLGDLGSKLMQARKQAIEADSVSSNQTDAIINSSTFEQEERSSFDPLNEPEVGAMAERVRKRMVDDYNKRLESMPTGDAQAAFRQRMEPMITKTYMENLDWENQTRAKSFVLNIDTQADKLSTEIYKAPSLSKTLDSLTVMKQSIDSKVGAVIRKGDEGKIYAAASKKIISGYVNGLAESLDPENIKRGRMILQDMPPQMAAVLDSDDLRAYENRFDQAERKVREANSIAEAQRKKALDTQRDAVQDSLLGKIYQGSATYKDIIYGEGKILSPETKRTMLNVLKSRENDPKTPDERAMKRVMQRVLAPDGDPRKFTSEKQIMDEYAKDGSTMTYEQMNRAIKEFKRLNSEDGKVQAQQKRALFKQAASALTKTGISGMPDPNGDEQVAKFTSYALTEIDKYEKAGKDPSELLDANSPKYLGNQIPNFKKSNTQAMNDAAEKVRLRSIPKVPDAPPPPGKVRVLLPNGQRGFVPQDKVKEFEKRGAKVLQSGRGPSSVDDNVVTPRAAGFIPRILYSDNPGKGLEDAFIEFSKIEDPRRRSADMELLLNTAEEAFMDKDISESQYNSLIERADKFILLTPDEQAIERKNADYFETLKRQERLPSKEAGPSDKSKGNLPDLKTRKATKQDLERLKKLERDGASFK